MLVKIKRGIVTLKYAICLKVFIYGSFSNDSL